MNHKIKLSVLFQKERGGAWVGQCLERDIAAQGATLERAVVALRHTLAAQCFLDLNQNKEPLKAIKPAPDVYRERFDKAVKVDITLELSDTCDAEVDDVRLAVA